MMNKKDAKIALTFVQDLQKDISNALISTSSTNVIKVGNEILPFTIIFGTRGYIEEVAKQINSCYATQAYDACLVMIRRLIETLIIECYEQNSISTKIKDSNQNFFMLDRLIDLFLNEQSWHIGRNSKTFLRKAKKIGDNSAHNRRYIATKSEIDRMDIDLRTLIQELVYISGLK